MVKKKDIIIIASINANKNLPYQSILLIIGDIVLVVSSAIVLIEDQIS